MSRPRGGKNREWSKEEKLKYVLMVINWENSTEGIQKEYGISGGMVCNWIKKYNEYGIEGLQNKRKTGNPLAKYSKRKTLTEFEQLEYENMLLKIENERLKKGYTEEDAIIAKTSIRNTK